MHNVPPESREGFIMLDFLLWCAPGGHALESAPCCFIWRPETDDWDAICQDCTVLMLHMAQKGIDAVQEEPAF